MTALAPSPMPPSNASSCINRETETYLNSTRANEKIPSAGGILPNHHGDCYYPSAAECHICVAASLQELQHSKLAANQDAPTSSHLKHDKRRSHNRKLVPTVEGDKIIAERFRTKLCRNYLQHPDRPCPYEDRCMFAHGDHELRTAGQNVADGLMSEDAIRDFKQKEAGHNPECALPSLYFPQTGIPPVMNNCTVIVGNDLHRWMLQSMQKKATNACWGDSSFAEGVHPVMDQHPNANGNHSNSFSLSGVSSEQQFVHLQPEQESLWNSLPGGTIIATFDDQDPAPECFPQSIFFAEDQAPVVDGGRTRYSHDPYSWRAI